MKATIHLRSSSPDKYPRLMKSIENDLVVLFCGPSEGTVVNNNDAPFRKLGDHSVAFAMCCFEPLRGSVTLTEEE